MPGAVTGVQQRPRSNTTFVREQPDAAGPECPSKERHGDKNQGKRDKHRLTLHQSHKGGYEKADAD